jgi:hypothetical protein
MNRAHTYFHIHSVFTMVLRSTNVSASKMKLLSAENSAPMCENQRIYEETQDNYTGRSNRDYITLYSDNDVLLQTHKGDDAGTQDEDDADSPSFWYLNDWIKTSWMYCNL